MQLEPPAETCLISGEFCNKEATVGTAVWWQKQNATLNWIHEKRIKKSVEHFKVLLYLLNSEHADEMKKCASRTQENLKDK